MRLRVQYLRTLPRPRLFGATALTGEVDVSLVGDLITVETIRSVQAEVRRAIGARPGERITVFWEPPE